MSIEPTCDYCGWSDKLRCKSQTQADKCPSYREEMNIKMSKPETPTTSAKLADLAGRQARSVVAVIDALAQRGAFKGEELATIGMLRDQSGQIVALAETVQSELSK